VYQALDNSSEIPHQCDGILEEISICRWVIGGVWYSRTPSVKLLARLISNSLLAIGLNQKGWIYGEVIPKKGMRSQSPWGAALLGRRHNNTHTPKNPVHHQVQSGSTCSEDKGEEDQLAWIEGCCLGMSGLCGEGVKMKIRRYNPISIPLKNCLRSDQTESALVMVRGNPPQGGQPLSFPRFMC